MKLNFITDQGSILASTSWARRVDGACLGAAGRPDAGGRALGAGAGAMARAAVAVWAADRPGGGGGGGGAGLAGSTGLRDFCLVRAANGAVTRAATPGATGGSCWAG